MSITPDIRHISGSVGSLNNFRVEGLGAGGGPEFSGYFVAGVHADVLCDQNET